MKFSVSGNGKSIFHILSPKIHGINFRSSLSHTPYLSDHQQILSSLPSTFQSQPSWLQLLLMPLVLSHRYRSPGLLHYPRRGLWKTSSFVLPQPSLFSVLKSEWSCKNVNRTLSLFCSKSSFPIHSEWKLKLLKCLTRLRLIWPPFPVLSPVFFSLRIQLQLWLLFRDRAKHAPSSVFWLLFSLLSPTDTCMTNSFAFFSSLLIFHLLSHLN